MFDKFSFLYACIFLAIYLSEVQVHGGKKRTKKKYSMGCPCGERKVSEREETDCRESMKLESPQNERYNLGMVPWFFYIFVLIK